MRRELLLGAGNSRKKRLWLPDRKEWENLTTLDLDPHCEPDVLWDLNNRPYPFAHEWFTEIHAYEVLEHVGRQGDWRGFFEEFAEYWRILVPGGHLILSCPKWDSPWAWGDPGHTRVISQYTLGFLDQEHIAAEVGVTAMTDYREWWRHSFRLVHASELNEHSMLFALEKV